MILAYQLTLSQPGWAYYAHQNTTCPFGFLDFPTVSLCDDVSNVSAAFQSKIAYLAENSLLVDLFRQTAGIKYLNTPQRFWHFRFRNGCTYKKWAKNKKNKQNQADLHSGPSKPKLHSMYFYLLEPIYFVQFALRHHV